MSCEEKEKKKIEEDTENETEQRKRMANISLYKYIGESSRSLYERGLEHLRDRDELKADSHMIKHFFDKHSEENLEDMKFGAKILKQAKTAFNRQIGESVAIQSSKDHHLLNSKSEYNRCALPRLTAKLGEVSLKTIEREKREEKEQEEELRKKIRDLKVKIGEKRREQPKEQEQPAAKKRKLRAGYKRVIQESKKAEKRQGTGEVQGEGDRVFEIFKRRRMTEFEEYIKEKEIEAGEHKGEDTEKNEEQLQREYRFKQQEGTN